MTRQRKKGTSVSGCDERSMTNMSCRGPGAVANRACTAGVRVQPAACIAEAEARIIAPISKPQKNRIARSCDPLRLVQNNRSITDALSATTFECSMPSHSASKSFLKLRASCSTS